MRLPQLRVGNIDDAAPKIRFSQVLLPVAEMLAIKCRKLRRHPCLGVHAIRDTGNRHLVHRTPDHTSFQSDRLTPPCNLLTPFAWRLSRNARIVMLNGSSGLRRVWPNENNSSNGTCSSLANLPKYFCIISREKESLPAGTGVCVVKTFA